MPKVSKRTIQTLLETTYDEVGDKFLDCLVQQIATLTNVQTVMIHRLLTAQECKDMKENEGCPPIQVINSYLPTNEHYLFIKACYSTQQHNALKKYSAVAFSSFSENSPHLKTLDDAAYHVTQDTSDTSDTSPYPSFSGFVGLRLDTTEPIGLISVMHHQPLDKQQVDFIMSILKAVQKRVTNEVQRLRQRDNLIMIKNAALQDAENKIRFLADMSHEIRTPLNAVIALTDLLLQERHLLNDEQAEHLQVIQTSGNHLLTVINDILDISKMNHNPRFKLEYRRFSLRKCIKDALNMARHQAASAQHPKLIQIVECPPDISDTIPIPQLIQKLKSIGLLSSPPTFSGYTVLPFIWKIDPEIPDHLTGDTVRLTQILINLCSNATKFTKTGGIQIKISKPATDISNFKERYAAQIERVHQKKIVRRKKTHQSTDNSSDSSDSCYYDETEDPDSEDRVNLEISVTDTGIGMPADRLPRLFKSFSQIDISTARKYGGTGLGLAISSMLVSRMGGELWVESEEGVGSRFALTLPMAIAQEPPSSPSSSSVSSNESFVPILRNNIPQPTSTTGLQNILSKTHFPETAQTVPKKVEQEENLAIEHPIKILLAEDNICKYEQEKSSSRLFIRFE
ncbi:hypothetical protein G6F46_007922 [Rhizopus delemar]|uniref:Histidine kinase domain-containing protein n=2 Tax=Rhizopus TaxID=4842 RepID=A0A9P7CM52_9FUNG|nr:hypothetical protein G6F55_007379 [Rhizopus delemar]KAG1540137.1 hypothetical protein G6F51_008706 [Rhizopus arrhizus]KAG1494402.1 hypothetical protein G6F54_007902 [Rhizopus delemar]KAG1510371.1 hypothetical protein G6F53_006735 [Rhizopus delemar]KAG1523045.1 hypothetical protein G6F52_005341 [Rhizopus delemar]